MIDTTSAVDGRLIGAVLAGLVMFGAAYNAWMTHLGDAKEGYVALLVAGGCAVTLVGVAIIDWRAAALCLGAFIASGIPMIIGDIKRYVDRREAAKRSMRREIGDDGEA